MGWLCFDKGHNSRLIFHLQRPQSEPDHFTEPYKCTELLIDFCQIETNWLQVESCIGVFTSTTHFCEGGLSLLWS